MSALWPHQAKALDSLRSRVDAGASRVVLTSPTGGGKSRMAREIMGWGDCTAMFTNRRMLFRQLAEGMEQDGIGFGRIASGYDEDLQADIQLCMTPTAERRMGRKMWQLPPARIVLVDECHNEKGRRMREIMDWYCDRGATCIGLTATPTDLGGLYDELIVAGTNSELRKCKAHVMAFTYAPSEIDTKMVRKVKVLEDEFVSAEYRQAVVGSVYENWLKLNPNRRPTILFAPGVKESLWFATWLYNQGVRAAHIDSEHIWRDGASFAATDDERERLKRDVAAGVIEIVCNRFVLREGIDIPELEFAILATVFGSLAGYLQAVGRVIRWHHSHDRVTIIDHGGNWHRMGSVNSDREWSLEKSDAQMVAEYQEKQRQQKQDDIPEPIVCPECSAIRLEGPRCHGCGYMAMRGVRNVIQENGELREMRGDIYRPRVLSSHPDAMKMWISAYFRALNSKKSQTFRQAASNYRYALKQKGLRADVSPDPSWPYMPKDISDSFRSVKDVPRERLIPDPTKQLCRGGAA